MKNKWKVAFFFLLGAIGAIILILFILIAMPPERDGETPKGTDFPDSGFVPIDIRTTKTDLNRIINHYLDSEGFTGQVEYEVLVSDEVELYGAFPLFGREIGMVLTFEPQALDNGDLILKQKSVSLGAFNLPVSQVMKIIKGSYKLPEWVEMQPSEKTVYVSLSEMELKSDIQIRANTFDLKKDDISFTLLVPVE